MLLQYLIVMEKKKKIEDWFNDLLNQNYACKCAENTLFFYGRQPTFDL